MTKDLQKQIGQKIYRARKHAKLTQEALAEAVDKTPETISNIERGHVLTGIDTLDRIAEFLEVPLRDFFEADGTGRKIDTKRAALESRLSVAVAALNPEKLRLLLAIADTIRRQR